MSVTVSGGAARGTRGKVTVTVKDARGRAVKRAKVAVSGAARAKARRTNKRGLTSFSLRPRRKGAFSFRVTRSGYRAGVATLTVP